jgi:hypothetical protein
MFFEKTFFARFFKECCIFKLIYLLNVMKKCTCIFVDAMTICQKPMCQMTIGQNIDEVVIKSAIGQDGPVFRRG